MAVPIEFLRASRAINRHEAEAVAELLTHLQQARTELLVQIVAAGDGGRMVLNGMLHAVDVAIDALQRRMTGSLLQRAQKAAQLGHALADASLPALPLTFHLNPELLQALQAYQVTLVQDVTNEMKGKIKSAVQRGILAGKPTSDIAKEIGLSGIKRIGPFRNAAARSEAIARTELQRIASIATHERYKQAGTIIPGLKKTWLSAHDVRVRPAHAAADGQTVGVDEDYIVDGESAAYPLDPRLTAGNSVRCRCRSIAVVPD